MRGERIGEWVGWLYVLFFICDYFVFILTFVFDDVLI